MIASIGEKTFKDEVLSSPIPVVVNFWTPWCGPCKLIEPLVMQLKEHITDPLKIVRINADENFWLSKRFNLTSVPTVLVFYNGNVVHRLEHINGREDVLKNLTTALNEIPHQAPLARPAVSGRPHRPILS
jgi:thioredoxin 1